MARSELTYRSARRNDFHEERRMVQKKFRRRWGIPLIDYDPSHEDKDYWNKKNRKRRK